MIYETKTILTNEQYAQWLIDHNPRIAMDFFYNEHPNAIVKYTELHYVGKSAPQENLFDIKIEYTE
jgi:hypothetical protein